MIGFLCGICCGVIEYLLLQKLVAQVTEGEGIIAWWIPLVKIGVMIIFLVPIAFFFPKQLYLAGAGLAGVLIIGAATKFIAAMRKEKKRGAADV